MTVVRETESIKIEGEYKDNGAIQTYTFTITEFEGEMAQMNSGQYIGEVRTLIVLPNRAILITDTDAHDDDSDVGDWDPDDFEWIKGTPENITEVFEKYADL